MELSILERTKGHQLLKCHDMRAESSTKWDLGYILVGPRLGKNADLSTGLQSSRRSLRAALRCDVMKRDLLLQHNMSWLLFLRNECKLVSTANIVTTSGQL